MTDVSRALALPDLRAISDHHLKTLALYWDEVTLVDYRDRSFGFAEPAALSEDARRLKEAGALKLETRTLDVSGLYAKTNTAGEERIWFPTPPGLREPLRALGEIALDPIDDALADRAPILDPYGLGGPFTSLALTLDGNRYRVRLPLAIMGPTFSYATAVHYLTRAQDALTVAEPNHLAPVATSLLAHLGSMAGASEDGLPLEEACLLSAAVDTFEIPADTPIEDIVAFREKSRASLGRFRASLVELRDQLEINGTPQARLASARDTYRNRVEPALSALEDSLKESRLTFVLKSVTRATVLATAPIEPALAIRSGAQFTTETVRYAFSRKRMTEQHPFGFLHKLSSELGAVPSANPSYLLPPGGDLAGAIATLLPQHYSVDELIEGTVVPRNQNV
jgi:hypothetical protein